MSYRRRCPHCQNLRHRSYFRAGTRKCRVCRYTDIARREGDLHVALVLEVLGHKEAELRAAIGRSWAHQIAAVLRAAEERAAHA